MPLYCGVLLVKLDLLLVGSDDGCYWSIIWDPRPVAVCLSALWRWTIFEIFLAYMSIKLSISSSPRVLPTNELRSPPLLAICISNYISQIWPLKILGVLSWDESADDCCSGYLIEGHWVILNIGFWPPFFAASSTLSMSSMSRRSNRINVFN